MAVSLGFLCIVILIIIPGVIYRKLYFYGDFSKEFNAGHNIISLSAISSFPGLVLLFLTYISFDSFFIQINLNKVFDLYKNFNNLENSDGFIKEVSLKYLFDKKVIPFIGYQYFLSIILGAITGRIIRVFRLDTTFKLLRFKNQWFYLFHGKHSNFKKLKHLKEHSKKHIFTKADILVDSSDGIKLYSGIVVDYEVNASDSYTLSKVMLTNAVRYNSDNILSKKEITIPGSIFIVNCHRLVNVNLTYIYEEADSLVKSKIPSYIDSVLAIIFISILPLFIFNLDSIDINVYKWLHQLPWYKNLLVYLLVIEVLSLLNPYRKTKDGYRKLTVTVFIARVVLIVMYLLLFNFL